jgi:hypothetical protein
MSERRLVVALSALAVLLGLAIVVEAGQGSRPGPAASAAIVAPPPEAEPAAETAPAVLVASTLARPLFAPSRRPADLPSGTASVPGHMPRLSGIFYGASMRRAIFQGADGKPLSVGEGDTVQGLTVRRIGATEVEVVGPSGSEIVTLRHDPSLAAPPNGYANPTPVAEPVSMAPPVDGTGAGPTPMPPPPLAGPGPAP